MNNEYESAILSGFEKWFEPRRSEFIADIARLVAIRSVQGQALPGKPFGEEPARAVAVGEEYAAKYGLEAENDGNYTLSFLVRGKSARELAVMGHVDVVPEGNDWIHKPFEAALEGDWLVGRGTGDNKGPCVAALYAMMLLRDLKLPVYHTLRVIWGANEESGMLDAIHFAQTHTPPLITLVSDAAFPLCYGEKGIIQADLAHVSDDPALVSFTGGVVTNAVPDFAEMVIKGDFEALSALGDADVTVEAADGGARAFAKGIAGHAAFPENSVSAIRKLAAWAVSKNVFTGGTAKALAFIADAFSVTDGSKLGLEATDDIGTSTTAIGGLVRLEDGEIIQNINVRYAIKADADLLTQSLTDTCAAAGFEVRGLQVNPARYDDLNDPRLQLLLEVSREFVDPEGEAYLMGGGTHARKLKNAIPFGPSRGFDTRESPYGSAHGHDEAVYLPDLIDAIKVYAIALWRLDCLLSV